MVQSTLTSQTFQDRQTSPKVSLENPIEQCLTRRVVLGDCIHGRLMFTLIGRIWTWHTQR